MHIYSEPQWWHHPVDVPKVLPGTDEVNARAMNVALFYQEAPSWSNNTSGRSRGLGTSEPVVIAEKSCTGLSSPCWRAAPCRHRANSRPAWPAEVVTPTESIWMRVMPGRRPSEGVLHDL